MTKRESLENLLLNDISSGRVKAGEKIPSRNMLMKKYDLSRDTVEKAVGNLIRAGVLYARQGAGTVVAQGKVQRDGKFSKIVFIYPPRMTPPSLRCFESDFEVDSCTCDELAVRENKYRDGNVLFLWFYPGYGMLNTVSRFDALGFKQLLINRRFGELPYVTIDYESGLKTGLLKLKERCKNSSSVISCDIYHLDEPYHAERLISFYRAAGATGMSPEEKHSFIGNDPEIVNEAVRTLFVPGSPKRGITVLSRKLVNPFLLAAAEAGRLPGRDFELLLSDYHAGLELYPGIHMLNQRGYHIIGEYMLQLAASALKKGVLPRQKVPLELISG